MIFKINGETYEIENFDKLSSTEKNEVYDKLMLAKTVMDTLAENGYIEHGTRVKVYKVVVAKMDLIFVQTTDVNVVEL